MSIYIRRPWGHCQRTDRKVALRDLVEDGEIPGLLVDRYDADKPHPQRRLAQLPPDLPPRRPSPPLDAEHTTARIGALGSPETGQPLLNPTIITNLTGVSVSIVSNELINTANLRASAIDVSLPWRGMLPLPDGAIDEADRKQTGQHYAGHTS